MSFPLINPYQQFADSSGAPLASGTVEFQNPTSAAKIDTFPTRDDADAQTNANDNPLTLSATGAASSGIFLEDGVIYKMILKDANGNTVTTQDDILCPINFYPTTSAETSASVTPSNFAYPEHHLLRYGANTTPGTTDMTTPLTNMIAVGKRGVLPAEHILFTNITIAKDFVLEGVGPCERGDFSSQTYATGTVLESNTTTGDGITFGDGTTNYHVECRNLSVWGATTGSLVYFKLCPRFSIIDNLFIGNNGSGYGIRAYSMWVSQFSNIDMWGDATAQAGVGFYFDTTQGSGGGNTLFKNITASNFNVGLQFGSAYAAANIGYINLKWMNCQGRSCEANDVEFLQGVSGIVDNLWIEGSDHEIGVLIADESGPLTFNHGTFTGTNASKVADVQIGRSSGNVNQNSTGRIIINGARFGHVNTNGIERFQPPLITNCANNGSGVIRVTCASHGLVTGDKAIIFGVSGTTEANERWTVTNVDTNNFDLDSSTFSNTYTKGGSVYTKDGMALEVHSPRFSSNGGYGIAVEDKPQIGGLLLTDPNIDENLGTELPTGRIIVDQANATFEYMLSNGSRGIRRFAVTGADGGSGSPELDLRGHVLAPAAMLRCGTSSGAAYIYLPDPPQEGERVTIWKNHASNDVTIDPGTASIIDFATTVILESDNDFITLESVGTTEWRIVDSRITATATWNPGSIDDGNEEAVDITLTGAALGDFVIASLGVDLTDLTLDAQVSAANTVTAVLANNTGSAVNLGSSTLTVRLIK